MKFLFSVLAAIMLLGAMSTPAEARCWWNGYSWQCAPLAITTDHHNWKRIRPGFAECVFNSIIRALK